MRASDVGDVVGMKLAEVNADIRRINNRVLAGICSGEEATRLEATSRVNSNSARSRARNDRRRRRKSEYQFERESLLKMRPAAEVANVCVEGRCHAAAVKSSGNVPEQFQSSWLAIGGSDYTKFKPVPARPSYRDQHNFIAWRAKPTEWVHTQQANVPPPTLRSSTTVDKSRTIRRSLQVCVGGSQRGFCS